MDVENTTHTTTHLTPTYHYSPLPYLPLNNIFKANEHRSFGPIFFTKNMLAQPEVLLFSEFINHLCWKSEVSDTNATYEGCSISLLPDIENQSTMKFFCLSWKLCLLWSTFMLISQHIDYLFLKPEIFKKEGSELPLKFIKVNRKCWQETVFKRDEYSENLW